MTAYVGLSTSMLYEWTGRILLFSCLHARMSAFPVRGAGNTLVGMIQTHLFSSTGCVQEAKVVRQSYMHSRERRRQRTSVGQR